MPRRGHSLPKWKDRMIHRAVLDTNILVSAFWSSCGTPARLVSLVWTGKVIPCYSSGIIEEYMAVLRRPAFNFSVAEVTGFLRHFRKAGFAVEVEPSIIFMPDESDRKFYDVAKVCGAVLITGNKKHYPREVFVLTAAEFLQSIEPE